jgi:hypothetical protein
MNVLLPVVTAALVSMLFGSVAAALISHVLSSRRSEREYRLKKLEELQGCVAAWCIDLVHLHHGWGEVARGTQTWNLTVEQSNEGRRGAWGRCATALTIANLYFEELVPSVEQIRKVHVDMETNLDVFSKAQEDLVPNVHFEKEFDDAIERIEGDLQDNFNERLYEAARQIRRRTLLGWLSSFRER